VQRKVIATSSEPADRHDQLTSAEKGFISGFA
jgi:hypothetical protein